MNIEVRVATRADARAIADLAQEAHAYHAAALPDVFTPPETQVLTPAAVVELCGVEGQLLLVATSGSHPIGYAHAEVIHEAENAYKRARTSLHVRAMSVANAARNQGAGHLLLEALRAFARERAIVHMSLEVYSFNDVARTFYDREGFRPLRELWVAPVDQNLPSSSRTEDTIPELVPRAPSTSNFPPRR